MLQLSEKTESTSLSFCYDLGQGFDDQPIIARQDSDGKILFAGLFTTFSGIPFNRIIRLNTDGTIDSDFKIGNGFDDEVYELAIQPDGKIVVGGYFSKYNNTTAHKIIRLNYDGSVDDTFKSGLGFDFSVWTISIQSDGKILVGGEFKHYDEIQANYIIRLNIDGTIDTSFNYGDGFNADVFNIVNLDEGKNLILGSFTTYNGQTHNRILRIHNDGSVDTSFNVGSGFNRDVYYGLLESDGSMIIVGAFNGFNTKTYNRIIKLNADGSVDQKFVIGDGFQSSSEYTLVFGIYKYLDKYFVTGDFNFYDGITANGLIKLNSDGSIDTSFDYGTGLSFVSSSFNIGLILDNGVHIEFGRFNEYNGYRVMNVIFLNPLGRLLNCPNY